MKIKVARKNRENLKAKRYPNGMHAETKSACPFNESRNKEKHANGMQEMKEGEMKLSTYICILHEGRRRKLSTYICILHEGRINEVIYVYLYTP